MPVFRSCFESDKHKPEIQNDIQVATSLQINAIPAFLIGKIWGDEVARAIVLDTLPFRAFEAKLKDAEDHW
jgi:predicted DsbA family dithiol-disulfide isomerase